MYKIECDQLKKFVKFSLSGFIKQDEMEMIMKKVEAEVKKYSANEAVFLADMRGFKPASPETTAVIQKYLSIIGSHLKKKAGIHDNVVAKMQMIRLSNQAHSDVERFESEEEAMKYLFE